MYSCEVKKALREVAPELGSGHWKFFKQVMQNHSGNDGILLPDSLKNYNPWDVSRLNQKYLLSPPNWVAPPVRSVQRLAWKDGLKFSAPEFRTNGGEACPSDANIEALKQERFDEC